jgi:hypothetical protein
MPRDDRDDYQVGYGKPPRHTQFAKGQSGNPRGRPSGSKNLATLVSEALNEMVIVAEDGGRRKISKCKAIVTQIVNKAAKADLRAIKILLEILREIESKIPPETAESSFSAADDKVLEQIKARWNPNIGGSDA